MFFNLKKSGFSRLFSYTLEISLGGSTMPSRQYTHFSTADYEACGRHFCETLLDYSDPNAIKESLRDRILQKLMDEGSTADEPKNVQLSDYSSLSNSETDGEGDDESDEGRVGDISKDSNSEKMPVSQVSNSNLGNLQTSSKNHLKRQVSIRKHYASPLQQRKAKSAYFGKKSAVNDNRSPLPIHRASVDFTKVITKQRKLEEPIVLLQPPSSSLELEDGSLDVTAKISSKLEEYVSASYRRLSKFRRKSKRHAGVTAEMTFAPVPTPPTAKCTTILFDDPFKPPGKPLKQQKGHHSQSYGLYSNRKESFAYHTNADHMDWLSGTEDECDPYDRPAPTIKITNCCEDSDGEDPESGLNDALKEMGKLKLSSSDNEQEAPVFAPFTPSFPVGRAFLHQTCYPADKDKSGSPKRGGAAKLTNSLSDTTISAKCGTMSARRSSISYLVSSSTGTVARGGKIQATGSTIFGSSSSSTSTAGGVETNNRRRVSWTGTLTVSVPNVPAGTIGFPRSPTLQQQRKKSFRKSRSLNDTSNKPEDTSPNECCSAPTSSSVSVDRIPGPGVMMGIGRTSNVNMGSVLSGNGKAQKWSGAARSQQYAHPSSTTSASGAQTLGKVKKRGKLKRNKHK